MIPLPRIPYICIYIHIYIYMVLPYLPHLSFYRIYRSTVSTLSNHIYIYINLANPTCVCMCTFSWSGQVAGQQRHHQLSPVAALFSGVNTPLPVRTCAHTWVWMCTFCWSVLSGWATKTPPLSPVAALFSGMVIFRGEHSLACAYLCSYMRI